MSSELSIQPRPPLPAASEGKPVAETSTPAAASDAAKPAKLFANPDFRFDPAAGLVVIEFLDNAGKVTDSIPTQRQLDAYRAHQNPRADDGKTTTG